MFDWPDCPGCSLTDDASHTRHVHTIPNAHRPLIALVHPGHWGAALSAFAQALAACPRRQHQQHQQQPAAAAVAAHPHVPRPLALRLHDGEMVVAAFAPTDEKGTVLCTLTRRPRQG